MAILEVKNICKSFDKTEVLKGVSFSMEKRRRILYNRYINYIGGLGK